MVEAEHTGLVDKFVFQLKGFSCSPCDKCQASKHTCCKLIFLTKLIDNGGLN